MHRPIAKDASNIKSLIELVTLLKSGNCMKLNGQMKCNIAITNSINPPVTSKILDIFFKSMIFSFYDYKFFNIYILRSFFLFLSINTIVIILFAYKFVGLLA